MGYQLSQKSPKVLLKEKNNSKANFRYYSLFCIKHVASSFINFLLDKPKGLLVGLVTLLFILIKVSHLK